ncbi:porin family protein [Olleya aquimaris]|uniref:Outer membrane protein with beta-barrel domain n=1 Tax=Olleya aquimaris TaxID=639310 RepID=A0A327RDN1_9FLAO|nr:porin family protein [Olleya aquimaris]RAJ15080.1 outer membrane protein with beta-barrel domain [Olleya aquimaris]
MKKLLLLLTLLFIAPLVVAQEDVVQKNVIDSLYREDQFYLGITYNLLNKKPKGVSQNGFSSGIHFGVIRDMPINKRRNKAIGIGLGLSFNSYNHNILIAEANKQTSFTVLDTDEIDFSKNKLYTYIVEMPIQYRWRTSTPTEYSFWRIYTGIKLGYVFANSTKYLGPPEDVRINNNNSFNTLQYGLTMSAGYNTWNFYLYYGLNSLFDNATINDESLDMSAIKIGLMFYIL